MKGIDIPINAMVEKFKAKLWNGKTVDFNGRVFRNEREINGRTVIVPEIFISGKEYKSKVFDDFKDAGCFFDVSPNRNIDEQYAMVDVCFYVNLNKIYPAIVTERATENVHEDVMKLLEFSDFEIQELITGIEAFADYQLRQNKVDMQPYYVFKFKTKLLINEC